MKLTDFVKKQAGLVGIAADNADLKTFLDTSDIANVELPTVIANLINGGLFNLEGAKNNVEVKSHYVATAYNGIDAGHRTIIGELDFDPAVKTALLEEKSTGKRETMLFAEIRKLHTAQLEAAKADGGGDGESAKALEAAKGQITELSGKLETLGNTHQQAMDAQTTTHNDAITGFATNSALGNFSYANKELPLEANVNTASYFVEKAIAEKGITKVYNKGALSLQKDGLDYMEESKPVSFNDFAKNILTENKLLDVAGTPGAPPTPGTPPVPGAPPPTAPSTPGVDAMVGAADQHIQNLEKAPDHSV